MTQPTPYARAYSFASYQVQNPTTPLPGQKVDLELNTIKTTLDQIITNLGLIQRDDGALANNSVSLTQLDGALISLGFSRPTTWVTATAYTAQVNAVFNGAILYVCLVSHTSGTFATDLVAGKWSQLVDFTTLAGSASTSATSAQGYAATAQGAATSAQTYASASAASYLTFSQRFLGTFAADPTVDNLGNALINGALYWNSATSLFKVYNGAIWNALSGVGILAASSNLSDLTNISTARANLGLTSAATAAATAAGLSMMTAASSSAQTQLLVAATTIAQGVMSATDKTNLNTLVGGALPVLQTLTYGATVNWDVSLGKDAKLTMTGNGTLANQTNTPLDAWGYLTIVMDATGGRAVSFGTDYAMIDGSTIPVLTAPNATLTLMWRRIAASGAGSVVFHVAAGAGVPVLLNTLTASASASLSDTTSITSAFRYYDIVFENLVPVTNSVNALFQPQVSAAFQTSVAVQGQYRDSGGSGGYSSNQGELLNVAAFQNTAGGGVSGKLELKNPAGALNYKAFNTSINSSHGYLGNPTVTSGTLVYLGSTAAVTGFLFKFSSGSISTGIIKIYGRN